jgi:hypothetical protein
MTRLFLVFALGCLIGIVCGCGSSEPAMNTADCGYQEDGGALYCFNGTVCAAPGDGTGFDGLCIPPGTAFCDNAFGMYYCWHGFSCDDTVGCI